jgi:chemotaxis protein MotB
VDVKVLKGVVMISLSDKMLYKTGDFNIQSNAREVLGKVAKVINDYDTYSVLIEGNTDNVSLNSATLPKDNWELSALRATSMAKVLQTEFGVNPSRITAGGRSEYNPKTTNASVSGRAENRRTEIIIMPKLDEFMKLMDIAPVKK